MGVLTSVKLFFRAILSGFIKQVLSNTQDLITCFMKNRTKKKKDHEGIKMFILYLKVIEIFVIISVTVTELVIR
jgi:hypothetical protein